MTFREVLAVAPLVVFIFWIGLYPKFFLDYLAPAVDPIGAEVTEYVYAEHGPPQTVADSGIRQNSVGGELPKSGDFGYVASGEVHR